MNDALNTLSARAQAWLDRGRAGGWFEEADATRLASVERASPADLIADAEVRPLIVALFGGTGVGKSSLLNRIAGEAIARVGVERPTSREVTVFVHESIELARLPADLPLDRVQIRRHRSDDRRHILWIDAPDIDSTEEDNRRCAMAWLPHVHLVCYVVSPERYRDDAGWRVLQERGHRHGWMFILNRWDEGDALQRDDLARMLVDAGFENPLLACTSSGGRRGELPTPDELDVVQSELRRLLQSHGVEELTRCGYVARLRELDEAVGVIEARLGSDAEWQRVADLAREHWVKSGVTLSDGIEWPLRTAASRLAVRNDDMLDRLSRMATVFRPAVPKAPEQAVAADPRAFATDLWDDWARSQLDACLDSVEVALRHGGTAAAPARRRLDEVADRAHREMGHHIQARMTSALTLPGSSMERALFRATGAAAALLPSLALLWVAYTVVVGYYRATTGRISFLGTDFAVHSILLVGVAWILPYIAHRKMRPSLETAALGALRQGFAEGLSRIGNDLTEALQAAATEAQELRAVAADISNEIARLADQSPELHSEPARRMLARGQHATELAVRR